MHSSLWRTLYGQKAKKGQQAEAFAVKYLQSHGLELISQNFSCKCGEIDIIMHDAEFLVFIEVRYRKQIQYGHPLETIDYRKQQKIINTVQYYLLKYPDLGHYPCRIDAIAIYADNKVNSSGNQIEWIKDAIQLM